MTITILRPSTRILTPGARGIRYAQPGGGAAPWWMAAGVTPIVAYQAKGAASYAASKVNLAQPGTYNATEYVAPSWDAATGWSFNGTDQALRVSTINPGPSSSVIVSMVPQHTTWGTYWGQLYSFGLRTNGSLFYTQPGKITFAFASPVAFCGTKVYSNAEYRVDFPGPTVNGRVFALGAGGLYGTPLECAKCRIMAFVYFNTVLVQAQVTAITAAMAAL